MPGHRTRQPHPVKLFGLCGWAAVIGLLGTVVAGRISTALLFGGVPGWYVPTLAGIGLIGVLVTTAAFTAVHQPRLPWLLLCTGNLLLVGNLLLAAWY